MATLNSYNLLWLEWSIGSVLVGLSGLLVLNYSELLPTFIHRIVKYGKSASCSSGSSRDSGGGGGGRNDVLITNKLKFLELPKRFFFHFYFVALLFYIILLILATNIYFNLNLFDQEAHHHYDHPSAYLRMILDYFASYDIFTKYRYVVNYDQSTVSYQRAASVDAESVLIGLCLLITQVSRRLYECLKVSVYSDARMNVIHYLFGHSFYFGVGLSMLAEAPGFTGQEMLFRSNNFDFVRINYVIGIFLFIWASYIQLQSHTILANLRKDSTGHVYTTKHMIPRGNWFELVSSPHYMAEILIYLAITIVLGGRSLTWWMVFLFVVTNQIFVGKFNHSWYIETFKDYPKSRRAIIPYVL